MNKYRRVAYTDRCHIHAWIQANMPLSEISARLGFNRSTIYREIKRNRGAYRYSPHLAEGYSKSRYRLCRKRYKLSPSLAELIARKIEDGWSPVQISGRLAREGRAEISHECIYQYIRKHKRRFQPFMRRLGRRGAGRIIQLRAERRFKYLRIDQRPPIVDQRRRIGDWERDSMLALNRKSILVCTERKSRYCLLALQKDQTPQTTTEATLQMIKQIGRRAFTITNDRGTEFKPVPGIRTYYCAPQSPQQRGTVENTIGLLRQYITNKTDLTTLSQEELKKTQEKINLRPRKCLDFKTPYEVLFGKSVALAI